MSTLINYDGIDEVDLIHALYHGTRALGMGRLHDRGNLDVSEVRLRLGAHIDEQRAAGELLFLDYFHGRPLKLALDLKTKTFNPGLYDRDAGQGAAEKVVAKLREQLNLNI